MNYILHPENLYNVIIIEKVSIGWKKDDDDLGLKKSRTSERIMIMMLELFSSDNIINISFMMSSLP